MKNYKGFHYYIVMAVGIATALLLMYPLDIKAETDGTPTGFYSYTEVLDVFESVKKETASNGTVTEKFRYQTHYDVTIWTSDPACFGIVSILSNSIRFSGTYSTATIQGRSGTVTYINGNESGTNLTMNKGTGTININGNDSHTEVVLLDDTQLQALIDAAGNTANLTDIENKLNLVNQYLSYLYNGAFDGEDNSYLELVYNILNGYIETIATSLDNIDFHSTNIELDVQVVKQRIINIRDTLTELNQKFPTAYGSNVLSKLDTLNTTCNAIITAINTDFQHLEENIDDIIDKISWTKFSGNWGVSNSTSDNIFNKEPILNNDKILYFTLDTYGLSKNKQNILHIRIPIYNTSGFDLISNTFKIVTPTNKIDYLYYVTRQQLYYDLYIVSPYATEYSVNQIYLKISITSPYNTRFDNTNNYYVCEYITSDDIEFWNLLYYIKSFDYYQKTLENQDDTNNAINNLQNSFNTLNQFEQQQTESFQQALGDIDMNLDFDTAIPDFTNTLSYFKTVNETIINEIPMVKYIVFIILIVLIWGLLT